MLDETPNLSWVTAMFRMITTVHRLALGIATCLAFGFFAASAQAAPVTGESLLAQARTSINNISTAELQALIAKRPELVLIDVRTPDEIASLGGTIKAGFRTHNINRGWLELRVSAQVPDKSTPVVLFCGIGQRSPFATQTLMRLGYTEVYNYEDGFFKWRDEGLPVRLSDDAPGSMLFSAPAKVAPGIWSSIGETGPPTRENSGHNNNLSFIITGEGVVVVNAGDNYLLAQALHAEIKKHTDQRVKYVFLENGQGHAMLGMNYWQEQGAIVVAHEESAHEIEERGIDILERMTLRNRDKAMGTVLSAPDKTFTESFVLELGGERIEALNLGPAHSPGDIVVWLPTRKVAIAGDMAFHQRLLPVFEETDTAAWVESWNNFEALGAEVIVPGHGAPTTMEPLRKYTVGYLKYMRGAIGVIVEDGGTLDDAYGVDQSAYAHLDTFDELALLNAGRIFRAMEFE
jgi:glyoxylase-like metal-dependent hydrolase (beta-lactamase superfamily II)/rhodanese-related sulfurtransferase